nr:hypothetical protein [Xenorhabdus bovienii]
MGYSLDFRKRVLAYKDKHSLTFEQTSAHFGVAIRTLFRWSDNMTPKQNFVGMDLEQWRVVY